MPFCNGGLSGYHTQGVPSVNGGVRKINPARIVKCVIDLFVQPVRLFEAHAFRPAVKAYGIKIHRRQDRKILFSLYQTCQHLRQPDMFPDHCL